MFNKPLQQKYGRQRKLNYTSIPSAFSLAQNMNFLLKHRNCRVTSRVGKPYQGTITRIYLRELPKKLKQILFGLY